MFINTLPLKIKLKPIIVCKRRVLPIPFGPEIVIDCPEIKLKFISRRITLVSTAQDNEFIEIEVSD